MSTWTNLDQIKTPARVAALPRDARGYPIPYFVLHDQSGRPDFRAVDPEKWMRAVKMRCCGICGGHLGARVAFVGGPNSMANRLFTDLPMHRDCATYAVQVCPFIAAPKFAFSRSHPEDRVVRESVSLSRPDRFGIGVTKGYDVVRMQGEIVLHAREFESIEWWREGRCHLGDADEAIAKN